MADDLERFYELLCDLETGLGGSKIISECHGHQKWPFRGVYFFLDPDESCELGPGGIRVVRVGTHALKAGSNSTLWRRLRTHKGTLAGFGDHRASVFRRHVGQALMVSSPSKYEVSTWDGTRPKTAKALAHESQLEHAVSEYIGSLRLLWIAVPDSIGSSDDRAYLEKNAIGLLAEAGTLPSHHWLGHSSPNPAITMSGLWNVSHVTAGCDPDFFARFQRFVKLTA